MKIIKIKKKRNNLYEITLSDQTSLSFYDDTIIHFNLLSNKEFNNQELLEITKYNQKLEAYYKSLKLIAIKMRTKKELIDKLKKDGYSENIINKTINRLESENYLNDERYIISYINDQINLSLKGPNKILYDLTKLGFSKEQINPHLDNIESNIWKLKAEKIVSKKISSNHKLSNKMLINKIRIDLLNLGYSNALIENVINNISFCDENEILEKEFQKEYRKLSKKYNGNELNTKIKYNLYKKGFSYDNINNLLKEDV